MVTTSMRVIRTNTTTTLATIVWLITAVRDVGFIKLVDCERWRALSDVGAMLVAFIGGRAGV